LFAAFSYNLSALFCNGREINPVVLSAVAMNNARGFFTFNHPENKIDAIVPQ